MSQLDEELKALRLKLAALEERKRIETETAAEKKANPARALNDVVTSLKGVIERNSYSKSFHLARFYDRRTLSYLEPILEMLTQIHERLELLEQREQTSGIRIDRS